MKRRSAVLAALFARAVLGQFSGLSSTGDGTSLYFVTTLRLKGAAQPRNGKVFVAGAQGVTLFRARDAAGVPPNSPPCTAGGFAGYLGAETSTVAAALLFQTNAQGPCSYPVNTNATEIVSAVGSMSVPGIVRLSAGGRYAVVYLSATSRPFSAVSISYLDLQTGAQTPAPVPVPGFPQYIQPPYAGARVVANDGTALVAIGGGSTLNAGYLIRPGADPQLFAVPNALPIAIDAGATKVLYQSPIQGLGVLDVRSGQTTPLASAELDADGPVMSDDGRRVVFRRGGQAHLVDTDTGMDRVLTSDPAQISAAAISGDASTVYAVTGRGVLLKISADSGAAAEVIGHTPYLDPVVGSLVPGFTATLLGSGLSDSVVHGTVPLNPYLGNVTMWVGERKVPMIELAPTYLRFLLPWDISGDLRLLAEAPGDNTPFDYPEVETTAPPISFPRAGAIARQDWTQTYSGPVNTGEYIHVWAAGFGAVSPEVPEGAAAPSAEPFSRLTRTLACSNAEVTYAGLAPGTVERAYQIDLRIGPTPGYQKFTCTLDGADPFVFLTLNVVQ